MDVMNMLAQARPASLDAEPDADRRASDLALAMATPRAAHGADRPGAARRAASSWRSSSRSWRSSSRPTRPVRLIAIGTGIAAVAGTAGAVVALSSTGTPAARPPQFSAAHAGTAVTTPGEIKHAILTAVNGVWGDIMYTEITETYAGKMAKYNDVQQDWTYPIRPQAGQVVRVRSILVPSNPADKSDIEYIYPQPGSASAQLPAKTEMIYVQYGNRTWSDTYASIATQSAAASLEELHETIATGDFTKVGTTVINGQPALELINRYKGDEQTMWVDPSTYVPIQTLSDDAGNTNQVDYEFLTPTPANLKDLRPPIPAGFKKTPTIKG